MPARILVAEDDDGIRSLIGVALRKEGYEVEFAADGDETIAAIGVTDYDAILLDLMMPGASGFEVLASLHRKKSDIAKKRVIIVTAMAEKDLKNLTADRVFAVIRKPFDLDDMLATVARCISA